MFTREINGIPVVGAGSKVTITFLNDGSVESFRFDWPRYERTNQVQTMVSATEILQRVQRIALGRTGYLARGLVAPPLQGGVTPIDLGVNTRLEQLSCGYYDPGFKVRDAAAPIQAGCYYHVIETRGEGDFITHAGYSGAVPAVRNIATDRSWPEAILLSGRQVNGPVSPPPSAGTGATIRPVPPRQP